MTLVPSLLVATLTLTSLSLPAVARADAPKSQAESARDIEVVVDKGFQPAQLKVKEGERVRIKFIKKDYGSCTREVVFPSLGITRTLPTNQTVVVELPPQKAGEVAFHCGMKMSRGTIVVEPRASLAP